MVRIHWTGAKTLAMASPQGEPVLTLRSPAMLTDGPDGNRLSRQIRQGDAKPPAWATRRHPVPTIRSSACFPAGRTCGRLSPDS
jgi:hypothetical protein